MLNLQPKPIGIGGAVPFDIEWNVAVMHIAGKVAPRGFNIVERWEDTPDTMDDMVAMTNAVGRITVTTEGGKNTIYGDEEVYAHFRGWHDTIHYRLGLDFTIAGEAACTYVHAWEITKVYGRNDRAAQFCGYVLQDIMGQQLFKARQGHFPPSPRDYFVQDIGGWQCLAGKLNRELQSEQHALHWAAKQYGPGNAATYVGRGFWQCATDSVGG